MAEDLLHVLSAVHGPLKHDSADLQPMLADHRQVHSRIEPAQEHVDALLLVVHPADRHQQAIGMRQRQRGEVAVDPRHVRGAVGLAAAMDYVERRKTVGSSTDAAQLGAVLITRLNKIANEGNLRLRVVVSSTLTPAPVSSFADAKGF